MQTVKSQDGAKIVFEQTGTGPTLIMIDPAGGFHGFRPMEEAIPLLTPHFTVVTYDRRGRGNSSEVLPYSVEREVEDIEALIKATSAPVFLYGFSSGAVLALLAASAGLSVKKIVLLEPPLERYDQIEPPSQLEKEIADLIAQGKRREAHTHFSEGIGVPPEVMAEIGATLDWVKVEALAHTIVYDLTITRSLPTPKLAAIKTPTLVIDSLVTGDEMHAMSTGTAEILPNGVSFSYDGDWHGVPVEILASKMIEFFSA